MKKFSFYSVPVAAILCAALFFSCSSDNNSSPQLTNDTFTDTRDNKPYKWVKIGTQIWMAENLNYNANGSKCGTNESKPNYNDAILSNTNTTFCDTYGRLYDWTTAMAGVCPTGWHIPSKAEWIALMKFVNPSQECPLIIGNLGGCYKVGAELKAVSGWYDGGNGTDAHGFTALPGGYGFSEGNFYGVGESGHWWSDFEIDANTANFWVITYDSESFGWAYSNGNKSNLYSVRCLKN